jgi:hypothetical protein
MELVEASGEVQGDSRVRSGVPASNVSVSVSVSAGQVVDRGAYR